MGPICKFHHKSCETLYFLYNLINAWSHPIHCVNKPVCTSEYISIKLYSSVSASLKTPMAKTIIEGATEKVCMLLRQFIKIRNCKFLIRHFFSLLITLCCFLILKGKENKTQTITQKYFIIPYYVKLEDSIISLNLIF